MTQPSINTQLYDQIAACAVANDVLRQKRELLNQAHKEEERALEAVNKAQIAFDNMVAQVHSTGANGTFWKPYRISQ